MGALQLIAGHGLWHWSPIRSHINPDWETQPGTPEKGFQAFRAHGRVVFKNRVQARHYRVIG